MLARNIKADFGMTQTVLTHDETKPNVLHVHIRLDLTYSY
jgi:hypothetical protein